MTSIDIAQGQEILKTVASPGFVMMLDILDHKIRGLEAEMAFPKENTGEDMRMLQLWRGYVAARQYLKDVPEVVAAQFQKIERDGKGWGNQQNLFEGFNETNFPPVGDGYPNYPPPPHVSQYR